MTTGNEQEFLKPTVVTRRHGAGSQAEDATGEPAHESGGGLWKALLLIVNTVLALIALYQVLGPPTTHAAWPVSVTVAAAICLGCHAVCVYGWFRSPYQFTSAYILALSAFHLGVTALIGLQIVEFPGWVSGPEAKWLERAGWYTILALSCLNAGFAVSLTRKGPRIGSHDPRAALAQATAYWDGLGLLAASAVMIVFVVLSVGNLLSYSRNDFFAGVGDTRGLGVFFMLLPSAAVLLMIGARTPATLFLATCVATAAFLLILLSGYRSMALFPALVGAVVWVKIGRRIPSLVAAAGVVLILIIIPIIGALRAQGPYQDLNRESFVQSAEESSIQDSFTEMGQTAAVLSHVFRLVPSFDPYRWGMSYVRALQDSIPNVSLTIAVSDREVAKRQLVMDRSAIRALKPSEWLTFRIAREKFDVGQGVGFSTIGEAYLNFGPAGVVGFFLILGFLLGRLDQKDLFSHPNWLVLASAMIWPLAKSVRNDFGVFIKPVIFMLLVIILWRLCIRLLPMGAPYTKTVRSPEVLSK